MERFKQINDFLADSFVFYSIAIGMDGRYSYVSNNYNRNFALSNGTLLGKEFSITLHPQDVSVCEAVGMQCFERPGELLPATLRKHDGKGGFVVTQWEMRSFFDAFDQPEGIFCIGYNITEYVDTRTKLDSATSEIAVKNDQLNEIGFMQSHVIRKPLANIMGLAAILESMQMDDELKGLYDRMTHSAKELDMVIRDISNKTV